MIRRRQHRKYGMEQEKFLRAAKIVSATTSVIMALTFAATGLSGELRTWKSANGNYSAEAEFVELTTDGSVRLKRKDGNVVTVPLDRLSDADKEFVRSHAAKSSDSSPSVAAPEPAKTPEAIEAEASACRTAHCGCTPAAE